MNRAPPSLVIICPSRIVFHGPADLRLCWEDPLRGPPLGGGDPIGGIHGVARCPHHAYHQINVERAPPSPLAVDVVREGGEDPLGRLLPSLSGLTFVPLDSASRLLGQGVNIN